LSKNEKRKNGGAVVWTQNSQFNSLHPMSSPAAAATTAAATNQVPPSGNELVRIAAAAFVPRFRQLFPLDHADDAPIFARSDPESLRQIEHFFNSNLGLIRLLTGEMYLPVRFTGDAHRRNEQHVQTCLMYVYQACYVTALKIRPNVNVV
jgi:hypothetical protein